jgi:hypothetical protein
MINNDKISQNYNSYMNKKVNYDTSSYRDYTSTNYIADNVITSRKIDPDLKQ